MRYRILGPLEVVGEEGSLLLGPPKQRALLGVLLLQAGEPVTTAALIQDLWGETPPRTAEHSIQSYVSGLRAVLGTETLLTTPGGYRMAVDRSEVDAAVFEQRAAEVSRASINGDPAAAFRLCGEALDMWRGRPLADVDLATTPPLAVRLAELRLQVAERWAAAALALGRPDAVLADLERLTLEHPLREPLWALRMRALAAAGRNAEALRVYQQLRKVLAEELGIDPSRDLQDLEESLLLDESPHQVAAIVRNPYKGLRPFGEADAGDFFGRHSLVRELVEAVAHPGRRMVSVVGPSGSGKSSAVRAGLIPALRAGAIDGSQNWTCAVALPARRPFEEVRSALPSETDDSERTLRERLAEFDEKRPLLLVLDQFEQIFTNSDEEIVSSFLDLLAEVSSDRGVRLVVTLRADFYHRPLLHHRFGRVFTSGVVHVHPLNAEELLAAAVGPAERVGAVLQPNLISELIHDVAARPGSLPLFQYALTEVFDRRAANTLTLQSYRAIGGVSGALIRRAEEVFDSMTESQRGSARQVFFRLVAVGEGDQVTRRRANRREIESLGLDPADLENVIERLDHHRLLSHDRDHLTGEPSLEVAHEALLAEWPRLRGWLEEARIDLRRRASLVAAREEWVREGHDPGFLLTGGRLEQYEEWASKTKVALTDLERDFLDESAAVRDAELAAMREADELRRRMTHRSRLIRWTTVAALMLALAVPLWLWSSAADPVMAVMAEPGGDVGIGDLFWAGIERAEQRHGLEFVRRAPLVDVPGDVVELCRSGVDLILIGLADVSEQIDPAAPECADTILVFADVPGRAEEDIPNAVELVFRAEEGSVLAGAAAALASETDTVGFVGGPQEFIMPFLGGFEAGVETVDPDVEVLAVWVPAFDDPLLGRAAADTLVEAGADVIFHAAGETGDGVLAGVTAANQEEGRSVWFIGVDVDEWMTAPPVSRPYVLTSVVKRLDIGISDAVDSFLAGELSPGPRLYGLANGGVDLTTTGGHVEAFLSEIDAVEQRLIAGDIEFSPWEPKEVTTLPLAALTSTHHGSLDFADGECSYEGPTALSDVDVLRITITGDARVFATRMPDGATFATDPISTEGPPPPDVNPATTRAAHLSLTLPAIDGTWAVGCITDEWVYPTAAITIETD